MTTGTATQEFKRRDAEVYSALPEVYSEYVHRISHFITDKICELAELRPGHRVLDVGSGTGMATSQAAELVAPDGYVLGIDHSEGLVEFAKQGAPRGMPMESLPLEYRVMDAEELDLEDESFDIVISFSSIMHFPNPDRALAEMYRVVKPKGRLVMSFTAIRPLGGLELVGYLLHRVKQRLTGPLALFAPSALESIAGKHLPALDESAEPTWSATTSSSSKRIFQELDKAGFRAPDRLVFTGRDVKFTSPEEFYEAQLMISSDLRTRSSLATRQDRDALREEFLGLARNVQKRGGQLLYPFGAVVLRAAKPG